MLDRITMLETLRDPSWQLVGIFVTVFLTIWIYWQQRYIKEIAFGLVSSTRPIAIADELSSRVTVQIDGVPVDNLHLLVYGLKNSGQCAIRPSDWEQHLSISFDLGKVVSAEIASQRPSNIGAELTISNSKIILKPLLLNAGDQFLIQVLLSSAQPMPSINARVVDLSSLAPINTTPKLPSILNTNLPRSMVISTTVGVASYFLGGDKTAALALVFTPILVLLIAGIVIFRQEFGKSAKRRIYQD